MSGESRLPDWLHKLLKASAEHPCYPLAVALIAFASAATFVFPFFVVLISAVLLAPRRWLLLGLLCGLASGAGGALLVEIFHFMGRELVLAHFPQLIANANWQLVNNWLENYGLFALLLIAGSPIPQTPAIFLYAMTDSSTLGALAAIGTGKVLKYIFLSWLTSSYPARFIKYR